jgi:hypothetical protein
MYRHLPRWYKSLSKWPYEPGEERGGGRLGLCTTVSDSMDVNDLYSSAVFKRGLSVSATEEDEDVDEKRRVYGDVVVTLYDQCSEETRNQLTIDHLSLYIESEEDAQELQ